MIVLDTNVVSELVRPVPARAVIDWVDEQDPESLVITSLTAAEVRAGVALLPDGRRQRALGALMESLLVETFNGYVLPFDVDSSFHYAEIVRVRTRAGHPIGALDAQIASVCRQHGATLSTRNTADFTDLGVDLVDPWQAS